MFFKKKVSVSQYCTWTLVPLFSQEREVTWEAMRVHCDDPVLNQVDSISYFNNLRAIILELMLIAITRNCSLDVSSDAHFFVSSQRKERDVMEIDSLIHDYSGAFGSSYGDGIESMVSLFAKRLTDSNMSEATRQRFLADFYMILKGLFEEFKSIKLVSVDGIDG